MGANLIRIRPNISILFHYFISSFTRQMVTDQHKQETGRATATLTALWVCTLAQIWILKAKNVHPHLLSLTRSLKGYLKKNISCHMYRKSIKSHPKPITLEWKWAIKPWLLQCLLLNYFSRLTVFLSKCFLIIVKFCL